MLPPAHIPVQPSSQECLAWSAGGELAVAAGEEVYLLVPGHGSPEPWTHVRITVSSFNTEEWPWQELASFKDMSIGEEQARATVTALAWSPPGLAKHGRSVLAVLTSNLILSFWASDSNPTEQDSWKRVLVVNKALSSGSRFQQRIRSMAWAPMNPRHVDRRTPFSGKKWGIPLIAVADDSNGLYILKISSPFIGQSFAWDVEVLRRNSIPMHNRSNNRPSLLSLAMNANQFVDHIEFGTWDGNVPVIYRTSGIVHHASLSVREDAPIQERPKEYSNHESLSVSLDEIRPGYTNMPSQLTVTPFIKARMATEREKFGLHNNIGSQVVLRSWGLASFNDLIAVCVTLHPAKMVDYTAPFEGNSTILFDAGNSNGNAESIFPWQKPAEVDVAKAQQSILDTTLDQNLQRLLALNHLDLRIIYTAFCGSLLLSDDKRLQRLQAATDSLKLIERHEGNTLLAEHRALLSIKTSPQLSDHEVINIIGQMAKARGQSEPSAGTPEKNLFDLCPFCPEVQGVLPFESFTEAYCPQGHPFGRLLPSYLTHLCLTKHAARCALTFLPLLEPGITKRCMSCKREFLDEQSHPGIPMKVSQRLGPINISDSDFEPIDPAQENRKRVKHSLAAVLFDRFDTCPYCGGKFCG